MKIRPQSSILGKLHRYQHLLVLGGGLAITVLLILLLQLAASVRDYVSVAKEEAADDVRRATEFLAAATATLRGNVQQIEQIWAQTGHSSHGEPAPNGHAQLPRDGGASPLAVFDAHPDVPDSRARRYREFAQRLAGALTATSVRNVGKLTAYLYSPDLRFLVLAVIPGHDGIWRRQAGAGQLPIERFAVTSVQDALMAQARVRNSAMTPPNFAWLPPAISPVTGKLGIRAATAAVDEANQPFGIVVYELPMDDLLAHIQPGNRRGECFILAPDGTLVLRCGREVSPAAAVAASTALLAGETKPGQSRFRRDQLITAWPLAATGWILVRGLGWGDIAHGVRSQILVIAFTTLLLLVVTWTALLLVRRKVFLPSVAQAERIFESEQLSRKLFETTPFGLGLISLNHADLLLSSQAMDQTARRVVCRQGSLAEEFICQFEMLARSHAHGKPLPVMHTEMHFSTVDEASIVLSVSLAPARFRSQDVLVVAFVDVTARTRIEDALRQARYAADAANAAKSNFLAMMSHEIRTPLNALLGHVELLNHSALDASQRDRLGTIRYASNNLLAIVNDVLDFSKIEAGELQIEHIEFDVLEIANRALHVYSPLARSKGLELNGHLGVSATLPMQGDPTRIGQILHNLLSNAIKFTDAGKVALCLRVDERRHLLLSVEDTGIGLSEAQAARLFQPFSQADDTITRRFGGTGLGLALCHRLATAMGGELGARSELGRGSCFTLDVPLGSPSKQALIPRFHGELIVAIAAFPPERAYLTEVLSAWGLHASVLAHPAQAEQELLENADALILWGDRQTWHAEDEFRVTEASAWILDCSIDAPSNPVLSGRRISLSAYGMRSLAQALLHVLNGEPLPARSDDANVLARPLKVLVVEDNAVNQLLFEDQLGALGCEADVVPGAAEALDRLSRHRYDVLITDLSMPGMNGYELAQQVRKHWPLLPVMAATANVTAKQKEQGAAAGISRVLIKPLSLEDLGAALSAATGVPHLAVRLQQHARSSSGEEEMRKVFLQSSRTAVEALRQASRRDDVQSVLDQLHSLHGAFNVFHIETMARLCSTLEDALGRHGLQRERDSLERFCRVLEILIENGSRTPDELMARIAELAEDSHNEEARLGIAVLAQWTWAQRKASES